MQDVETKILNRFLRSYVGTALWSSNDESDDSGGDPMDWNYDYDDINPQSLAKMREDCAKFLKLTDGMILEENFTGRYDSTIEERAAHDFWLTRNGHGAGFWDGDWDNGDTLTAIAKTFGECDLYVGDDGAIYC